MVTDTTRRPTIAPTSFELEQTSALFSSLFQAAPLAMLLIDASGAIRLANDQSAALLGWTVEELDQRMVDSLLPESSRASHPAHREVFLNHRVARQMRPGRDVAIVTADGREIPVEVSLTPLTTDEGPMVIAAVVDLTERRATEQALQRHADELARSNRDLGDFASVAAHDLRAPLRTVESLAAFVLEDCRDVLPEQSRADLGEIGRRTQRLMRQLDDLLTYARIGLLDQEREPVDTGSLLTDLATMYLPADRFTLTLAPDLPTIEAPRAALELVFRNLLMNVVKHHDRATGRVEVDYELGDTHRFAVTDDGPGIDPALGEAVFALFRTVSRRRDDPSGGMGLALVRRTVESNGGSVRLVAREGRGAVFEIDWPCAPVTVTSPTAPSYP